MQRCIELARRGAGHVAPNPLVGSVLVYRDRIIGEGYHMVYGQAHAEVNCIASVKEDERRFISESTIYVSLEPCVHYGKTPPCADLIIRNMIRKVVVGCRDPFEQVNGKGIEKLQAAGIEVKVGVLQDECLRLNRRFFTFHQQHRPYIILKWAQTADGYIGGGTGERLLITGDVTNRLVHKWRSEEASILVGTRTAMLDDPKLDNRHWSGHSPLRLVIDKRLDVPSTHRLMDGTHPTIVFNLVRSLERGHLLQHLLNRNQPMLPQLLAELHRRSILSILVEGGAGTIREFVGAGLWDEARVIRNEKLTAGGGIAAPQLKNASMIARQHLAGDIIETYTRIA